MLLTKSCIVTHATFDFYRDRSIRMKYADSITFSERRNDITARGHESYQIIPRHYRFFDHKSPECGSAGADGYANRRACMTMLIRALDA